MVTMVGSQKDFGKSVIELVELEYDAVEAYKVAISKVENVNYKENLKNFYNDHVRHIEELSDLLQKHHYDVPKASDTQKRWLTKGKVILANLIGDGAILSAMLSNEEDTNAAYEKMDERTDSWADAIDIIRRGFKDEKHHKNWFEQQKT